MQIMECTQQASQMCQPREYHYNIEYLMAITIDIMSLWIPSLRNPSSINHCTCQVRNGSYAGWLISSWWCTPHIFCMASSCSLTICNIINSMILVPYILLYSYLRSIYYFRIRINLISYAPGCQNVLSQLYILKSNYVVVTRRKRDRCY